MICPPVGSIRRVTRRARVDFPQPVSPTSPSVSPRFTSSDTSSTACTCPSWWLRMTPRVSAKCLVRPRTTIRSSEPIDSFEPGLTGPVCGRSLMASGVLPADELAADSSSFLHLEVAGDQMPGLGLLQLRLDLQADVHHVGAARMEGAAGRSVDQARR